MRELLIKYFFNWLSSHKVSLALVIAVWLLLSPSYNNIIQFQTKTEAKLEHIEKRFDKIDVLNEKMNAIMLKLGIQEYRIEKIEKEKK